MNPSDADKLRTPNPDCPACIAKKMHNQEEWKKFHPNAGKGSTKS
jgi:hypothetical protein